MPTSVTGTSTERRRAERGFSLLEIMVVVAIIGIFAGTLMLSARIISADRELEREALRLEGLLGLLREEALMQNRDYGVVFTETGYRFYVYDYALATWVPPPNERIFVDRALPEPMVLELELEERSAELEREFDAEIDEDTGPEPQILVLSTGEITPFDLGLYRDFNGGRYRLEAQIDGEIQITSVGFD